MRVWGNSDGRKEIIQVNMKMMRLRVVTVREEEGNRCEKKRWDENDGREETKKEKIEEVYKSGSQAVGNGHRQTDTHKYINRQNSFADINVTGQHARHSVHIRANSHLNSWRTRVQTDTHTHAHTHEDVQTHTHTHTHTSTNSLSNTHTHTHTLIQTHFQTAD